jgi:hypothetical protein
MLSKTHLFIIGLLFYKFSRGSVESLLTEHSYMV